MSQEFLGRDEQSQDAFSRAVEQAASNVIAHFGTLEQCYSGMPPTQTARLFDGIDLCPEQGRALKDVLDWVGANILRNSIAVTHPHTMAHLHCPPLIPAVAAEVMIAASNPSMDSWDQAPAATYLEQEMVKWLLGLFGLGGSGDGVFTSGGTQSNFMGLLLARDVFAREQLGWNIQTKGLPPQASRLRILCSEMAHFSVQKSAAILGLGYDAVVPVPADADRQMDPEALRQTIARLREQELLPFALVGTAGTTDFGSVDPLHALADVAAQEKLWLHVDAAYGGALMLSRKHSRLLSGIERADSVTVDFHKLFFQPISCSALLIKDAADWEVIRYHADYLNPEENENAGVLDLVTKSIQTTRRFDGLKIFVTLQTLGRERFAALVDGVLALAEEGAQLVRNDPDLQLMAPPRMASVVFRYAAQGLDETTLEHINTVARRQLLLDGEALIGMTRVDDHACVKFTLMNPRTRAEDLSRILEAFKRCARSLL
ncbi:pyridoxal phosphate-dependent decarboxylase family protein [Noviherbaspirillum galbum]|uniref:Aspartate aminotransferase family protein n=1 Tax=Noviherbaspirillum galbum TaxID=2709383 RepID=A0A6B3SRA2_9BURK|nr:aspartate aminotransferase family protein [Noviherbaspirillum galbum]NEX60942.1 aspartate aminotransferase family protein [Noviherbaspirillum galbum]